MSPPSVSRREALARIASAGAGLALGRPVVLWRPAGFTVAGVAAQVVATPVSPHTLRISVLPAERRGRDAIRLDGALVERDWPKEVRIARAGARPVPVGPFTVRVEHELLRIHVARPGEPAIQELQLDEATGALTFGLGNGPLLGMGQGGPQLDRRGSAYTMRSGQGGYRLRTHGGVVPIQWFVSTDGWALYIHQPLGTFDLTGPRGRFDPPQGSPLPLDVFVVHTANPAETLGEWAMLTGRPELPPHWSFGYQQSHRTLAGPDEVLWVARTFREKRLPCDTLIYLGTGFTPSGWNTQNGEFSWNASVFPDPKAILDELHAKHYRVVLHAVLEGKKLTGAVSDACPEPPAPGGGATGSGRNWPDEQRVACYWPIHRPIVEQGIDGWWPDQGDGLDAESRLARIRMYYEGMQAYRPNQRPYALHRNGYAGMARYAAFLWSGDVYSTWETLRTHVSVAINAGLSGIPFWGTDIGGFVPTPEYTGELHVRWFQFGAFCPLFRSHGRTWHLRLPWGWNTGQLGHNEIANYRGGAGNPAESELRNPNVEPICKQYLELRYRLLTYLYSAVRETHDWGLPIMRALWLHYPEDAGAAARGDEYLWGRDILVAPVVAQGATERTLYLPAGDWYDFWTNERHSGGREITRPVDLATLPLYVRAGAILPLDPVRQYSSEPVAEPLAFQVYPGQDGECRWYRDDGESLGYQRGEYSLTRLTWNDGARRLVIEPDPGSGGRAPEGARLVVRLIPDGTPKSLEWDGRRIEVAL